MNTETKPFAPEILAPAGNMEKLRTAVHYGADAVYLGGTEFSLRKRAGNFSIDELQEAIAFAHANSVKVYLTVNVFPTNDMIGPIRDYFRKIRDFGLDAVIVADPGLALLWKDEIADIPLHISTQANNMNYASVQFWEKFGASRVCLARELSLEEARRIRSETSIEIEAFVHGAMCIAYSGRCMMGQYMTGRDANMGDCPQSCRWKYYLVEEKRPNEFYPVEYTAEGAYLFNSKDMCTVGILPQLVETGIHSFKIEGRMKSLYYLAVTVSSYKKALTSYLRDKEGYVFNPTLLEDLETFSHRPYFPGFYLSKNAESESHHGSINSRTKDLIAKIERKEGNYAFATIKNKIVKGEKLEIYSRNEYAEKSFIVDEMVKTTTGETTEVAQPNDVVKIAIGIPFEEEDIIRKEYFS